MKRALVIGLVVVASSASALAKPADPAGVASALAKSAEAKAAAGDFVGAAGEFRDAFKADPKPEYVCNVGVAYYKASALPQAQFFLTECVLQGSALPAAFLDSLRKVQAAIEGKLRTGAYAPLTVVVEPSGATVAVGGWDPDETFVGGRTIWLPAGVQTLHVTAEDRVAATLTPTVEAGKPQTLRAKLEPVPAPPIDVPTPTEPVVVPPVAGDPPPVHHDDARPIVPGRPSRRPALIATVATGVVGLGAIGAYVIALGHATDAQNALPDTGPQTTAENAARTWRAVAVGGAALAAVGAGVSAYLWYRRSRAPVVSIAPTSDGATAFVTGTF